MAEEKQKRELVKIVGEHLHRSEGELAKQAVLGSDKEELREQAWDLVPVVCDYLTTEQETEAQDVISAAEEILVHLTKVANVKELLLVLLEQADSFNNDTKYKALLPPIQQCLLKLPGKKGHSIAIAMETAYAHLKTLPLPEDQQLEGKERVLLDLDEDVQRCNDVVLAFLHFMEPVVEEFQWKNRLKLKDDAQRKHYDKVALDLTKYLIKTLDHPLAYLDLSHDSHDNKDKDSPVPPARSASRLLAEKLMFLAAKLTCNFPQAVLNFSDENFLIEQRKAKTQQKRKAAEDNSGEFDELEHYDVEEANPALGMSTFCYLAFGEVLAPDNTPQVFTHEFLLDLNCAYCTFLLSQPNNLITYKGLALLKALTNRIPDLSLEAAVLELPVVKELIQALLKIMISSKVKELGQTAVIIIRCTINKFELWGRNQLLYFIMNTMTHTGVIGLAITMLKDEIDNNLKRSPPDHNFIGVRLKRLLNFVFALPAGEKTDLLEQSERIMGALNLLRYLVIRDKMSNNTTGIWNEIQHIKNRYCETLRKAVSLSRAHYELEIKKVKESKKGEKAPEVSFTVGNQDMAGMSKAEQLQVLHMATHTFDMMESILGRVTEVIDQQKKDKNSEEQGNG